MHKTPQAVRRVGQQLAEDSRLSEAQWSRLRHQMRLQAATLLEAVLDETLTAQMALNRWPDHPLVRDPSLGTALQALWHFEADEDLHRSEVFYLDAQLELLRQMWRCLREGRDLPPYLLKSYDADLAVQYHYPSGNPWQVLGQDVRNGWRRFVRMVLQSLFTLGWRS